MLEKITKLIEAATENKPKRVVAIIADIEAGLADGTPIPAGALDLFPADAREAAFKIILGLLSGAAQADL